MPEEEATDGFSIARKHWKLRSDYKMELAKARIEAVKMATRVIGEANRAGITPPKEVLMVMSEVLRDARDTLKPKAYKPRRGQDGIPGAELTAALDKLEELDDEDSADSDRPRSDVP